MSNWEIIPPIIPALHVEKHITVLKKETETSMCEEIQVDNMFYIL